MFQLYRNYKNLCLASVIQNIVRQCEPGLKIMHTLLIYQYIHRDKQLAYCFVHVVQQ